MRRQRRLSQGKRAVQATILVAIALAAIPVSGFAQEKSSWGYGIAAMAKEIVVASLSEDAPDGERGPSVGDIAAAYGSDVGTAAVPKEFQSECLDVADKADVVVGQNGGIVGYSEQAGAEDAFSQIASVLKEKGWVLVESGDATRATFVKESGTYRWLYAACTEIAGQTSVVIQTAKGD